MKGRVSFLLGSVLLAIYLLFFLLSPSVTAIDEEFVVVDTAEQFFEALRDGQYRVAWGLLTPKSQRIIVERVHRGLKKEGISLEREDVWRDFAEGGPLFIAYWRGFSKEFKPELVLEHCRWELKDLKSKDKATILLKCKATRPLKLFFLQGEWRVGFEESF